MIDANLTGKFRNAYERLSLQGVCDSPGGCEYERVFKEWKKAGCPKNIDRFIANRANDVPPVTDKRTRTPTTFNKRTQKRFRTNVAKLANEFRDRQERLGIFTKEALATLTDPQIIGCYVGESDMTVIEIAVLIVKAKDSDHFLSLLSDHRTQMAA